MQQGFQALHLIYESQALCEKVTDTAQCTQAHPPSIYLSIYAAPGVALMRGQLARLQSCCRSTLDDMTWVAEREMSTI